MHDEVFTALATVFTTCAVVTGCISDPGGPEDSDGEIATTEGALINSNSLNPNALNFNALNFNALNFNALNFNALNFNALGPGALASLRDPGPSGDLAREAMRYVVSCAFNDTASLSFSWTDGEGVVHNEVYQGLMGLAPGWASGPLSSSEAGWISACLASRTNWYGVSVEISSRGKLNALKHADSDERAAYATQEGAFWGNVFSSTPTLYACDQSSGIEIARQQQRDCAAGHVDAQGQIEGCGIIQLAGSCDDLCSGTQPVWGYRKSCAGTSEVITVYLQ